MTQKIGFQKLLMLILIALSLGVPIAAFAAPWTPIEWQNNGKWRGWIRDRNGNFVDDLIEQKTGKVEVIVDFNGCIGDPSTSGIVKYLNTLGDVTYVGKYVTFAIVKGVAVTNTFAIAGRSEVAMVELVVPTNWVGDNYRAAKIETSTDYKPNTLQDAFNWPGNLNGKGIGIAFLDTGVGPTYDTFYTHGYDAIANQETNPAPDSSMDHATQMASWVFGPSSLAPQASLIDMKVGTVGGVDYTALAKALDKVYEKRKSWGIQIVTLMFASNAASDGMDAISQQINLLASSGTVVMAAAGSNAADSPLAFPGAASRAVAITAADIKHTVARGDDTATYVKGPRQGTTSLDGLKPELAMPTGEGNTAVSISIATAETAGLAALVLQQDAGLRDLDNHAAGSLKDLLVRTAEPKGTASTSLAFPLSTPTWNQYWGFGEIDALSVFQHLTGQVPTGRTDVTFKGFDDSPHPSTPWYYSQAVRTQSEQQGKNIVAGVPDKISARIYNNGTQDATNVRVNFAFYEFTAGIPKFHDIGSVVVSVPAMKYAIASMDWTPPKLPAGMEHGCILVTIDYGYDTNYSNMSNFAQKNVQVKSTSSPATFVFRVENPLSVSARIDLKISPPRRNWRVQLSNSTFFMAPGDCARVVKAIVQPGPGVSPGTEALFFVTATAIPRGQAQGTVIGGVALKARFQARKNLRER